MVFNPDFTDDNHKVTLMNLEYTFDMIFFFLSIQYVPLCSFPTKLVVPSLQVECWFSLKINKTEFFCV